MVKYPLTENKCNAPGVLSIVRDVVKESNKAVFFASMLANAHALRLLENNQELPKFDKDFFYCCILLICSDNKTTLSKCKESGLMTTFNTLWGEHRKLVNCENHGSVPLYQAIKMETTLGNFNTIAIYDHMILYIKAKYQITTKKQAQFIVDRIMAKDPLNYRSLPNGFEFGEQHFHSILYDEVFRYQGAKYKDQFIQYRYYMLGVIKENSTDEHTYKSFTLLPSRDTGVKFVDMDISALNSMWGKSKLKVWTTKKKQYKEEWDTYPVEEVPEPPGVYATTKEKKQYERELNKYNKTCEKYAQEKKQYLEEREKMNEWEFYRDRFTKLRHWINIPKRRHWKVGLTFKTNGYEIHVCYERNKHRGGRGKAKRVHEDYQIWETDWDPKYQFFAYDKVDTMDPKSFASLDPNHHYLAVCATPTGKIHKNGSPEFEKRKFSKKRWNHETKKNEVDRKLEKMKKIHKEEWEHVQSFQNAMSRYSMKCCVFQDMKNAIDIRTRGYDVLYGFYSKHQYMKTKVTKMMATQKTYDAFIKFISWDNTKVVGWGDCAATNGFRGTNVGGPNRKLRRYAIKKGIKCCLVDENYTSKRSCCCYGCDMVDMKIQVDGETKSCRGLRICQGCGATWDRDFSAAINIFDIFYHSTICGFEHNVLFTYGFEQNRSYDGWTYYMMNFFTESPSGDIL